MSFAEGNTAEIRRAAFDIAWEAFVHFAGQTSVEKEDGRTRCGTT